jgi:hypothetical protein
MQMCGKCSTAAKRHVLSLTTGKLRLPAPNLAACMLCCLLQRLHSFAPDAVMALGLPVSSGVASDSCGCLLSHALGVPLIDMMGVVWSGPSSTPQVGLITIRVIGHAT